MSDFINGPSPCYPSLRPRLVALAPLLWLLVLVAPGCGAVVIDVSVTGAPVGTTGFRVTLRDAYASCGGAHCKPLWSAEVPAEAQFRLRVPPEAFGDSYSLSFDFRVDALKGDRCAHAQGGDSLSISKPTFIEPTGRTEEVAIDMRESRLGVPLCPFIISTGGDGVGQVVVTSGSMPEDDQAALGDQINLRASPQRSSTLAGWSGPCTGTYSTCTVTVSGPTLVSARFALVN